MTLYKRWFGGGAGGGTTPLFYICDTESELPATGNTAGDLAFCIGLGKFYCAINTTTWVSRQSSDGYGAANGYAQLDANTRVPNAQLGTGTANSTVFLRGDRTWSSPGASSTDIKQAEIDIGTTGTHEVSVIVIDADVSTASQLIGNIAYEAPTGRDLDEIEMEPINLRFAPGSGQFTLWAQAMEGPIYGKYKVNYLIG